MTMTEGLKLLTWRQDEIGRLAIDDPDLLSFVRLLAFIDGPKVPKALFDRAGRGRVLWTESGELDWFSPKHSKVPEWVVHQFGTANTWESSPVLVRAIENGLLSISSSGLFVYIHLQDEWRADLRAGLNQSTSLDCLFDVLAVVIHAFPEQHAEILCEEFEEHLWDVVESTILPFLAVLRPADIMARLSNNEESNKAKLLRVFLRFLSRLSGILGDHCPSSVLILHEYFYDCLYTEIHSRDGLNHCLFFAPASIQKAELSKYQINERSTTTQVFSKGNSVELHHAAIPERVPSEALAWATLLRNKSSSTMELLARSIFEGVTSHFSTLLPRTHSQFLVLLGFLAAKQQSFELARGILASSIDHVKKTFGLASMEYLITGTELANCHNFLMQEAVGEEMVRKLWNNVFSGERKITSHHHAYLATVHYDSLIGQAKYSEAETDLSSIMDYTEISSDLLVSTSLRLLKMSRRQRTESSRFDTWKLLEHAVDCIGEISDDLVFELVEEAICHISELDEDPAQLPRAEAVMKNLGRLSLEHYSGSQISKQTLAGHINTVQDYQQEFRLFTVTGPQLHFSRLIRDGFRGASIPLIERIGTANWNRFNRVKELPLQANILTEETCNMDGKTIGGKSEKTFVDSALGSSLQTASRRARSQISYHSVGSAIGGSLENFPPLPNEGSRGKPFECPICCKRLRGIVSASQWEHHVYADLQPYVCIINECSSNITTFGSRVDFTNHMAQHQDVVTWSCSVCWDTHDARDTTKKHILDAHPEIEIESAVISSTVRRNIAKEKCPFCGVVPGTGFVGHVCRHLEEIALTVLPKEVEWDSEIESNDGSSRSTHTSFYSQRFFREGERSPGDEYDAINGNTWKEGRGPSITSSTDAYTRRKQSLKFGDIEFEDAKTQARRLVAEMDTGSDVNVMSKSFAEKHGLISQDTSKQLKLLVPHGTNVIQTPEMKAYEDAGMRHQEDASITVVPEVPGMKPRIIQFGFLTEDEELDEQLKKTTQRPRLKSYYERDRSRSPSPIPMLNNGPEKSGSPSPIPLPYSSRSGRSPSPFFQPSPSTYFQPSFSPNNPKPGFTAVNRPPIQRLDAYDEYTNPVAPTLPSGRPKPGSELAQSANDDVEVNKAFTGSDDEWLDSPTPTRTLPRPTSHSSPVPGQPIFQLPRKNAAITIKRPDGTPVDLSKAREPPVPGSAEDLEERAVAAEAALVCLGCNRQYKSKKKWRKHVATHGRGLFLCRTGCGERFYTLEGRREHEAGHFEGRGGVGGSRTAGDAGRVES